MSDSSDPTFSFLALYEFEAKLHLGHPDLEGVLEKVSSTSLTEPKTFETIAGKACKYAFNWPSVTSFPLSHTHTTSTVHPGPCEGAHSWGACSEDGYSVSPQSLTTRL